MNKSLLILLLFLLTLACCACQSPAATETPIEPEPQVMETPAPVPEIEPEPVVEPEPALQTLIGGYKTVAALLNNGGMAVGALRNLGGEGQDNLIVHFERDGKALYQIWMAQDDKEALLLAEGELFSFAGASYGGVGFFPYSQEKYICAWTHQPAGDIPVRMTERYMLYTLQGQRLELVDEYLFRFAAGEDGLPDPQFMAEASFTHNGQAMDITGFTLFKESFDIDMEQLVVTRYEGCPYYAGQTMDELLRQLTGMPQQPVNGLERAVTAAIIAQNAGGYKPGDIQEETHATLKIVEQAETVTVYAIADYTEYDMQNGAKQPVSGTDMPIVITFAKEGELYTVLEYWEPEDGSGYEPSIREKFPADIVDKALNR